MSSRAVLSFITSHQFMPTSERSMSSGDMPEAYMPPTMAPMLVPAMKSIGIRICSSARITPTCEMPSAPPPPSASPIFGRSGAPAGAAFCA